MKVLQAIICCAVFQAAIPAIAGDMDHWQRQWAIQEQTDAIREADFNRQLDARRLRRAMEDQYIWGNQYVPYYYQPPVYYYYYPQRRTLYGGFLRGW